MSNTTNARRTSSYASIFSIINKFFGFSLVYFGHDKSTLTTKTVEAEESCLWKMKAYFQIQIFTLKWNTWKLWNPKIQIWIDLRNSGNLKWTNTRLSQSTPSTPSSGTWSPLLPHNDPIHHQSEIQSGKACVLAKEDQTLEKVDKNWWNWIKIDKCWQKLPKLDCEKWKVV